MVSGVIRQGNGGIVRVHHENWDQQQCIRHQQGFNKFNIVSLLEHNHKVRIRDDNWSKSLRHSKDTHNGHG